MYEMEVRNTNLLLQSAHILSKGRREREREREREEKIERQKDGHRDRE